MTSASGRQRQDFDVDRQDVDVGRRCLTSAGRWVGWQGVGCWRRQKADLVGEDVGVRASAGKASAGISAKKKKLCAESVAEKQISAEKTNRRGGRKTGRSRRNTLQTPQDVKVLTSKSRRKKKCRRATSAQDVRCWRQIAGNAGQGGAREGVAG